MQIKTLVQQATPLELAQAQWLERALAAQRKVEVVRPSGAVIATVTDPRSEDGDLLMECMGLTTHPMGTHAVIFSLARRGYHEFTFRVYVG